MARFGRSQIGQPRLAGRAVIVGLGVALLGLLMIQSSAEVRSGLKPARARMDDVTSQLSSSADRHFAGYTWLFASKASKEKIRELEAQVQSLQHWRESARTMAQRMVQYESILDLMGEPQIGGVSARIVAEDLGPFTHSRIANAGAVHGVSEGFAAVNEHGLVGRVVRTGNNTSRILLLTDYNSRIPVMGRKSLDRALLVGDKQVGAKLMHAETPDLIVEGEEWVTSGDDGVFERGLRVGFAHKIKTGWRLDLSLDRSTVDFVRLVPPPNFVIPEEFLIREEEAFQPNTNETLTSALKVEDIEFANVGERP